MKASRLCGSLRRTMTARSSRLNVQCWTSRVSSSGSASNAARCSPTGRSDAASGQALAGAVQQIRARVPSRVERGILKVRQRTSEPVEFPHDQRVARVQIVKARFQAGSVVARAGYLSLYRDGDDRRRPRPARRARDRLSFDRRSTTPAYIRPACTTNPRRMFSHMLSKRQGLSTVMDRGGCSSAKAHVGVSPIMCLPSRVRCPYGRE